MTWKSWVLVILLCFCRSAVLSQQKAHSGSLLISDFPVLTCQNIQLLRQSQPLEANTSMKLIIERDKFQKLNRIEVRHELVKKLKTGSQGETKLPKLKPGTYALELPSMKKAVAGGFKISEETPPGACVQTFSLEDRGAHFWLTAANEANSKANAPQK
jgi:hypothetical protein